MSETNIWPRAAVVYHIYPRSFQDSNGDGVGDLPGITSRLDYIKELGADAIWLSPFYKSPMADFGYDISDYCDVDPNFGTLEDFKELLRQSHNRELKVIVDYVPNHTSSQHKWFLESRSSRDNPKRNWYVWRDPAKDGGVPNNWLSVFGGTGWEWSDLTGQYYFHSFLKEQPDLNWSNPEVLAAMQDVLRFWLDLGVDGFRVDAINWLAQDSQFRDDPVNPNYEVGKHDPYHQFLHTFSLGQDETLRILSKLCGVLQEYTGKFMVTEVHGDIELMSKYFRACPPGLQSPFNFNLIGLPWQASAYKKFVDDFELSLDPEDNPNYVLGNHDQPRVASRLGQQRARLSALLQFTLRGMPFVYNGEELGMENGLIPQELIQDPFEKRVPGMGLGRDPQRTPMQWDDSANAGFSVASPWLPVNPNYQRFNAEVEKQDTRSMYSLYRQLILARKKYPALLYGKYRPTDLGNENLFGYFRELGQEKLFIVLNFSDQPQAVTGLNLSGELALTSVLDRPEGERVSLEGFQLRGYEGVVIRVQG